MEHKPSDGKRCVDVHPEFVEPMQERSEEEEIQDDVIVRLREEAIVYRNHALLERVTSTHKPSLFLVNLHTHLQRILEIACGNLLHVREVVSESADSVTAEDRDATKS